MYGLTNDPMPSDKLMKLFIIQAISSFVSRDYESGLHYLNEIKQTYAQHMTTLNPTLKALAKEIIQSLDLFSPGSSAEDLSIGSTTHAPTEQQQGTAAQPVSEGKSTSVASELQDLLNRRREKKSRREE